MYAAAKNYDGYFEFQFDGVGHFRILYFDADRNSIRSEWTPNNQVASIKYNGRNYVGAAIKGLLPEVQVIYELALARKRTISAMVKKVELPANDDDLEDTICLSDHLGFR